MALDTPTHNALRSMWGDGPKHSYDESGTSDRPQEIYTPQCIIDALLKVWPEGIALDPCSGPHSLVGAYDSIRPALHVDDGYVHVLQNEGDALSKRGGLDVPWPSRTFFNPPYATLKPWLAKYSLAEECIGLVPVRTRRKWWRAAASASDCIVYLDPLRFMWWDGAALVPHPKGAPPMDLCLMYRGDRVLALLDATKDLGSAYHD